VSLIILSSPVWTIFAGEEGHNTIPGTRVFAFTEHEDVLVVVAILDLSRQGVIVQVDLEPISLVDWCDESAVSADVAVLCWIINAARTYL
jgi:hypothetical protein